MGLGLANVYGVSFRSHSVILGLVIVILGLVIDLIQIAPFVNIAAGDKRRVAGGERMVKFPEEV